jgi:hypothetical protein
VKRENRAAAAAIAAFIQNAADDQDLLYRMVSGKYRRVSHGIDIADLEFSYREGKALARLKQLDTATGRQLHAYRIIYGYDARDQRIVILAIVPRSIDYDRDQDFKRQVLAAYDRNSLPQFSP